MLKIAIIGEQCAGKTTLAESIKRAVVGTTDMVKFADPLYDALHAFKQPKHRRFLQELGDLAKMHFGELVFCDIFRKCVGATDIFNLSCSKDEYISMILCDDVRRSYEVQTALDCGFFIVYVSAEREIRKMRAENQGVDFVEGHNSETEVPSLKQHADVSFVNNSDNLAIIDGFADKIIAAASQN